MLLRIIIEDYINHISNAIFKIRVDTTFPEKQKWYRTNRISSEFNLLYRWHPLVPTELKVGGASVPQDQFQYNNEYLLELGMEKGDRSRVDDARGPDHAREHRVVPGRRRDGGDGQVPRLAPQVVQRIPGALRPGEGGHLRGAHR
jgi:hypothetical protein